MELDAANRRADVEARERAAVRSAGEEVRGAVDIATLILTFVFRYMTELVEQAEAALAQYRAQLVEAEASCELFGLLKRPDEKYVTERAYDNPKFVEDLVRDIALRLRQDQRVGEWSVISENFESIHNHSAYARIVS